MFFNVSIKSMFDFDQVYTSSRYPLSFHYCFLFFSSMIHVCIFTSSESVALKSVEFRTSSVTIVNLYTGNVKIDSRIL